MLYWVWESCAVSLGSRDWEAFRSDWQRETHIVIQAAETNAGRSSVWVYRPYPD